MIGIAPSDHRISEHELYAVLLVDLCCAGVVVDGNYIRLRISLLDDSGAAFRYDVVRQTPEGLGADYVLGPCLRQCCQFRRDEPAFAHLYALVDILVGTAAQMLEIMRWLEYPMLFYHFYLLFLELVEDVVANAVDKGPLVLIVVELTVVYSVRGTVQQEIQQARYVRLTALAEQEFVQVVIG